MKNSDYEVDQNNKTKVRDEKSTNEIKVMLMDTAPVKSLAPKVISMLLETSGVALWSILEFSVTIEVGTVTFTPCMFVT
jgi:hypothetical protein